MGYYSGPIDNQGNGMKGADFLSVIFWAGCVIIIAVFNKNHLTFDANAQF